MRFLTLSVSGVDDIADRGSLMKLWDEAVEAGCEREILEARDDAGDTPVHKTSMFGHHQVLTFFLEKVRWSPGYGES